MSGNKGFWRWGSSIFRESFAYSSTFEPVLVYSSRHGNRHAGKKKNHGNRIYWFSGCTQVAIGARISNVAQTSVILCSSSPRLKLVDPGGGFLKKRDRLFHFGRPLFFVSLVLNLVLYCRPACCALINYGNRSTCAKSSCAHLFKYWKRGTCATSCRC